MQALKKTSPYVKAILAGEGNEKKRLEGMIREYGLEKNIELTGLISHKEVLDLMQRSKLLVHPSEYEGFSGVCMEALSCGAHVVSFCKPMNHDINHWHTADSQLQMNQIITDLLTEDINHEPVIISGTKTTALKIMRLFNLGESQ